MHQSEWRREKFGDFFDIRSGVGFKYDEYVASGIPLVKIDNVSHGFIKWENRSYLPESYVNDFPEIVLKEGDILLALNRPITRGQLKIARISASDLPAILYQRVGKIIALTEQTLPDFYYYLFDRLIFRFVSRKSIGSDQPFISITDLKKEPIPLPSVTEQKKIAQILSTWDQAITATERLLENSQQRKKGLMQQLLTGKKRLPGFEGGWRKIELGDALDYQQPTPFLVKSTEYSDDFPTPVLTAGKSFLLGYTDEKFGIYYEGLPVIIFDDFTTASQFVDFPFKAKSSAMKILTAKPGYSIRFIFEAMRMIRFAVGGHQRHWISIFANLVIPCPNSEEQQAISEVFATADREIASLQARLDSLKSEKKALMQQLLTGKRRVSVETEAA